MGPLMHVTCLFSLNFDSEKLQYSMVRIDHGPPGSVSGVKFHPFRPPLLAAPLSMDNVSLSETFRTPPHTSGYGTQFPR